MTRLSRCSLFLVAVVVVALSACPAARAQEVGRAQQPVVEEDAMQQRLRVPMKPRTDSPPSLPPVEARRPVGNGQAPAADYYERLLQLRKVNDLSPWVEPFDRQFTNADPANTERDIQRTFQSYSMLAESIVGVGALRNGVDGPIPFNVSHEFGPHPSTLPEFIRDVALFGAGHSDWNRYRNGLLLPQGIQQNLRVVTPGAIGGAGDSIFFGAWRGYRVYPKGQLEPVQKTYEEYAREGYTLEPFPRQVGLAVTTDTAESVAEVLFPEDYVVDAIGFHYTPADNNEVARWGVSAPFALVKIDPTSAPLMADFCSVPLLGWNFRRTSWQMPIPLTIHAGTRWTVRTKSRINGAYQLALGVDLIIYGSKLFPAGR